MSSPSRRIGGALAAVLALTTAPAQAQVSVQGEAIHTRQVRPGETVTGVIVVRNASAAPQEAKLYQTDYWRAPDGTTDYAHPGSRRRSNAPWISIQSRIVVPPRQTLEVPYRVVVPDRDSLTGSFWSMVMIESVPAGSAESSAPSPDGPTRPGLRIVSRFRYAVQVVSNVGAGGRREATFEAPGALAAKDGSRALRLDLRNSGEVAFAPAFTAELYAEDGAHVKTVTAVRELTYPGMAVRQLFNFGTLPRGTYRAVVTVDAGADAVFGAQYSFTL